MKNEKVLSNKSTKSKSAKDVNEFNFNPSIAITILALLLAASLSLNYIYRKDIVMLKTELKVVKEDKRDTIKIFKNEIIINEDLKVKLNICENKLNIANK